MDIDDMSVEEIENMLAKKKAEEKVSSRPIMLDRELAEQRLYDKLSKGAEMTIDSAFNEGYIREDDGAYTLESVMEAFYGDDVWDKINKVTD